MIENGFPKFWSCCNSTTKKGKKKKNLLLQSSQKIIESTKIGGDLNANKQHTHNVRNDDESNPRGRIGYLNTSSTILIEGEIQQHDPGAAQHEHESGGEPLDDVLPVDPTRQEDDGADGPGDVVLRGSDAGGLHDDVVDDSGDDHEVSEEDEGVDRHGGGEAEGRQLQSETRRSEEGERKDPDEVEDRVDGAR